MMARNRKSHPMIGKKIQFTPSYVDTGKVEKRVMCTGVVVWVHPQERFMVVEHKCPPTVWNRGGTIRECLPVPRTV